MADAGATEPPKLKHVYIWPEDDKETDRLLGDAVSFARKYHALLEDAKRERRIEKVRRRILGTIEDAAKGVYLLDKAADEDEVVPPPPVS